jgi:hypothetical protein
VSAELTGVRMPGIEGVVDPRFAGWCIDTMAWRWAFTDGAHVSRTFKNAYGITPAQWRASTSAGH